MSNDLLKLAEDCRFRAHAAEIMRHGNREVGNLPEFLREVAAALEAAQDNPVYELAKELAAMGEAAQPVGVPAGYIGVSSEADFEKYTWTFEMEGDYRVSAGRYLITRLDAAPSIPVPTVESSKNDLDNAYLAGRIDENKEWNDPLSATVELPVVAQEMQIMIDFLLGTAPLDGVWFGDTNPNSKGAFWWRRDLQRAWFAQAAIGAKK